MTFSVNVTSSEGVDSVWVVIYETINKLVEWFKGFLSLAIGTVYNGIWSLNVNLTGAPNGTLYYTVFTNDTFNNTLSSPGNFSSVIYLNYTYNFYDGEIIYGGDLVIQDNGSISNNTVATSNHGNSIELRLTGNLTILSGGVIEGGKVTIYADNVSVGLGGVVNVSSRGYTSSEGVGEGEGVGVGVGVGVGGTSPIKACISASLRARL